MANPLSPVRRRWVETEFSYPGSVFDNAREQDEERERRADEEHFALTGERRSRRRDDPLVDNDERMDIANDGNSYDELAYMAPDQHAYVEDSPSHPIDSLSRTEERKEVADVEPPPPVEDKEFLKKVETNKQKFMTGIGGLILND